MFASAPEPSLAPRPDAADVAACDALLRAGSRSFATAARLLPPSLRASATVLYAFCRVADDAIDVQREADAVAQLQARLAAIYDGRPRDQPVDRAFADLVARWAIPRALPEALVDGLAWDAAGRRYDNLSELYAYAARVAGAVGVMLTLLTGVRAPRLLARAADLGVAMQLTNIARDVGEDARAGRLYLPRDWLRDAGIDPDAWLAHPRFDSRLAAVIERLLQKADALYMRSATGIAGLPLASRPGMHAARLVYAEIGQALRRQALDSVARRAVVSPRRKLALLAVALGASVRLPVVDEAPPLAETRFLVDAAALAQERVPYGAARGLVARLNWTIALFERLERLERAGALGRG